jgi:hypothetical protein
MTKPELMKELEAAVEDAIKTRMWGTIGVQFSAGVPTVLRREVTKKIDSYSDGRGENNHVKNSRY